jgi:hypothetical protein
LRIKSGRKYDVEGNDSDMTVDVPFMFREPKFPVICDLEGYVIAAGSKSSFEKQVSTYDKLKNIAYPLIDISGEGWSFYPEHMMISPLTMKKKWFKKEIIAIFNNRKNNASRVTYSEKSLSAKRFDQIFQDIVDLLKNP